MKAVDIRKKVFDFIDMFVVNYGFGCFLEHPTEDNWELFTDRAEDTEGYDDLGVTYCSGATKGVLIFDDWDYVLKFPFIQYYDSALDKYEETIDYCKLEWRNYLAAKKVSIDKYFAETILVGIYDDFPIYAQEFLNADEEKIDNESYVTLFNEYCNENDLDKEDPNSSDLFYDCYYDTNERLEAYLWRIWEENGESAREIFNFLEENHINDIHFGNVAYRGDMLVLCDFSGYGWYPRGDQGKTWFDILSEVNND